MKELTGMGFDTVQYQLDANFEVCLTPKKSPITLEFKLESFLPQGFGKKSQVQLMLFRRFSK